jgi:hypothetical protein
VLDAAVRKAAAQGESSLTSSDDDRICAAHDESSST